MNQHVSSVYEPKKPFKCSKMGKMNHHVASVYGGNKPFKYNIFDANFSENGNMTFL